MRKNTGAVQSRCAKSLMAAAVLAATSAGAVRADPTRYAITQVGLTGGAYTFVSGTGVRTQYTQGIRLVDTGFAVGHSNRYDFGSSASGQDAWIFNGTSTV